MTVSSTERDDNSSLPPTTRLHRFSISLIGNEHINHFGVINEILSYSIISSDGPVIFLNKYFSWMGQIGVKMGK